MRQLIVLVAFAVALASAGTASAGGWASVAVNPLPTGVDAGETWRTEITVLQHGVTPLTDLAPVITIRERDTGEARDFAATAGDAPGVYEASVVFPEAGEWNVVVESGFWGEGTLTFGPETIGAGSGSGPLPDELPLPPLALVTIVLGLLAVGFFGIRRVWRPTPASR
jgi:hypothetical protein